MIRKVSSPSVWPFSSLPFFARFSKDSYFFILPSEGPPLLPGNLARGEISLEAGGSNVTERGESRSLLFALVPGGTFSGSRPCKGGGSGEESNARKPGLRP